MCIYAAEYGYLHILKWLTENVCDLPKSIWADVYKYNRLNILHWLKSQLSDGTRFNSI